MTDEKRPLKVFLCHSSADKPKVRELYRYLKRRKLNAWLDEENLLPGQDWDLEIYKATRDADAIIICLSKESVAKEGYVQKEVRRALDISEEKPDGTIFVIPLRLEECEVPIRLKKYQWVDLFSEGGLPKIMKSLKVRATQLERAAVQVSKQDENSPYLIETPKQESHEGVSVHVNGNVQGNIIIGNENAVQSPPIQNEKEKSEQESKEKAAREITEYESAEISTLERVELEAVEKANREKSENEAFEKTEREKEKRIAVEKIAQKKAGAQAKPITPKKSKPVATAGEHPAQKLTAGKNLSPDSRQANAGKSFARRWIPLLVGFILAGIILVGMIVQAVIFLEQPGNGFLKKTATATRTLMPTLTKLPSMTFTWTPTLTSTLTQLPDLTSTPTFTLTPDFGSTLYPTQNMIFCSSSVNINGSLFKTNCGCLNNSCACEKREYDKHGSFKSDTSFNGTLSEIKILVQKNGGSCQ